MKDRFSSYPISEVMYNQMSATPANETFLMEFNDTDTAFPLDKTVVDLFERQAELTPLSVAVVFRNVQYTYQEINGYANQLARLLEKQHLAKETLVPVCMERCHQMIIAILGILKAGGAYVPIDPDYPEDRIRFMLEDTQAAISISSATCKHQLERFEKLKIIELPADLSLLSAEPSANLDRQSLPEQLAYVIYTSGSTGKPKGVMIEHRGLVNLSLSQARAFRLQPGTRTLQFASFGFDASCSEIFTALVSGSCLVLPQKEDILSIEKFGQLVMENNVEVATLPPSYQLAVKDSLGPIRTLISAGEPLNEALGKYFQAKQIQLINAYGPTENTVCVSMSDDPIKENHLIVIGKPISNVKVYILDRDNQPCAIGTAGEICVGGVQVARGYLNRSELTSARFVPDPFAAGGGRMYRTGDLGRWCADGNIEFLGRSDDQVKIRGYRIEPGEIENVLHQCEWVRQAVVSAKKEREGSTRLVAYILPDVVFNRAAIIDFLKQKLPDYMIPSLFVEMKSFPVTASGKIDRKALPEPDMSALLQDYAAPENEMEIQLVTIWQKLFEIKTLGTQDNFFDLGGTSIKAIQMVSAARRAGYQLQPADLFTHQTIKQLAQLIDERLSPASVHHQSKTSSDHQKPTSVVSFNSTGTKLPFFFLSPGFSVYDKVVRSLDTDQPFHFFIPYPYQNVESIAAHYIAEMKKIQPEGPYCLGGYCGFGEVALEMAQQLTGKGEDVLFLALFEFYFPTAIRPVNYAERLKFYLNEMKSISVSEKASLVYQFFHRKIRKIRRRTSKVINRTLRSLPESSGYLIGKNKYAALPYDGTVLLFRSKERTARISNDPFMGWADYFHENTQLFTIDGDHKTMFEEPGATQIADRLQAYVLKQAHQTV